MKTLFAITKRNVKVFFKDKGMFFTSLITPIILLVLYATFLAKVYRDSFTTNAPEGFDIPQKIVSGIVSGELFSSLLAVSCVTVAFCSNMLTVQDKTSGARNDFLVSPVRSSTLSVSYFLSTFISTIIVTLVATAACFIYIAAQGGWFFGVKDVLLILSDVILLTLFGTALSSFVNGFISTSGQGQGVGTIVSAGYGFLCGAYMPIASFGKGLQSAMMFLPGTYGTSLLRNHTLDAAFNEMAALNFPSAEIRDGVLKGMKDGIDCNIYFFDTKVKLWVMYLVLIGATLLFLGAYVLVNAIQAKRK